VENRLTEEEFYKKLNEILNPKLQISRRPRPNIQALRQFLQSRNKLAPPQESLQGQGGMIAEVK